MEDGRAVANYILSKNDAMEFDLTNAKINKLVFLLHGWYLAKKGMPLLRNHVEAWQFGPVIRTVFESFKDNGGNPISNKAMYFDYRYNKEIECGFATVGFFDEIFANNVIKHYIKYSGSDLIEMTHKIGSPWHKVYFSSVEKTGIRDRIPNDLIAEYFIKLSGGSRSH